MTAFLACVVRAALSRVLAKQRGRSDARLGACAARTGSGHWPTSAFASRRPPHTSWMIPSYVRYAANAVVQNPAPRGSERSVLVVDVVVRFAPTRSCDLRLASARRSPRAPVPDPGPQTLAALARQQIRKAWGTPW